MTQFKMPCGTYYDPLWPIIGQSEHCLDFFFWATCALTEISSFSNIVVILDCPGQVNYQYQQIVIFMSGFSFFSVVLQRVWCCRRSCCWSILSWNFHSASSCKGIRCSYVFLCVILSLLIGSLHLCHKMTVSYVLFFCASIESQGTSSGV